MVHLLCSTERANTLLKTHGELVHEGPPPDGRGFTSVYVEDRQIERAWQIDGVNRVLPWRFRQQPISARLYPVPVGVPANLLQEALSVSAYQKVQSKVARQFGGRCQVCGAARFNRKDRRISPLLYTTWTHTAHPNPARKTGMRELMGIACVCEDCRDMLSLADPRPCADHPKAQRKQAWQKAIQRLAIHNEWSAQTTRQAITQTIRKRRALDHRVWVHDLGWLVAHKLLEPSDLILSRPYLKADYRIEGQRFLVPPSL